MRHFLKTGLAAILALLAAATLVAAQSTYKIRSGDSLQLEVLEDANLNRSLLVLPDGSVSVPLVGSLPAAGRTLADVRGAIIAGLAPNFAAAPTVFLSVGQVARATGSGKARTIDVFLMGEVANPGKMQLKPGTTLLQALAENGGLTKFATNKRIQLHRDDGTGQQVAYQFDYRAATTTAGPRTPIKLRLGDVIIVPPRRLFE